MSLVSQINALATRIGQEMKLRLKSSNNLSDLSNRQTALNNLANAAGGGDEYVLTKDTASGNIILKPAAGGGSGSTMDFMLGENIAKDAVVQIQDNGKIKAISGQMIPRAIPLVTPDTSMTTDSISLSGVAFHPTNDNLFAVAYYDASYASLLVRLGTITGTTITYGTFYTLLSGYGEIAGIDWDKVNTNKFVVAFVYNGTTGYAYAKVVTVSGSNLSIGSPYQLSTGPNTNKEAYSISYDPFATDRFIIAMKQDNNGAGIVCMCTISGTVITKGTSVVFCTGNSSQSINYITVVFDPFTQNRFVLGYKDTLNQNVAVTVGTVSGTTITLGSKYSAASVIAQGVSFGFNLSVPNQLMISWFTYYSSPTYVPYVRAGTISGTTISFGATTQVGVDAITSLGKIIFDRSDLGKFFISVASSNTNGASWAYTGIINGSSVTIEERLTLNASYMADVKSITNFPVTPGRFLFTYELSSKVYVCIGQLDTSTSNIDPGKIIGILTESGNADQTKSVLLSGGVYENLTALSTGAIYYVTPAGALTETIEDFSVLVGVAISSTKLKTVPTF